MENWSGRLAVFDLETTGVDVDRARIVSACVAVLEADGGVVERWDWLADPGIEIPEGASAVHGITTERARREGRSASAVVAEITQTLRVLGALGIPLVVYNAPYDLTLLDRECRRHGFAPIEHPALVIDPLVLDKAVDRYRKGKRTLEVTASLYEVALDDAHDAGSDAIAAGRVAQALARRYPGELDLPFVDLHGRQELWYAEQARSFQDYIRRVKGDAAFEASTEWPIRPPEFPTALIDTQPLQRPPRELAFGYDAGPRELGAPTAPVVEVVETTVTETTVIETVETTIISLPPLVEPAPPVEPVETPDSEPEPPVEPVETTPDSPVAFDGLPFPFDDDAPPADGDEPRPDDELRAPAPARPTVLRIAAAIVTDPRGRTVLVRKAGTSSFMQPGGKIEPGESAFEALVRELHEELGLVVDPDTTHHLGSFRAAAANEADTIVRAEVFALETDALLAPGNEIEELLWLDSLDTGDRTIAPLSTEHLLPIWASRRATLF
jgi:DNA polymerase III epsilon subunit-like protein/8-oxo-dGTP pyrophosphatase MutT (NUDIX family)